MISADELKELITKLLTTGHLNMTERKRLPGGVISLEMIERVIGQILESKGFSPGTKRMKQPPTGCGVQTEKQKSGWYLVQRADEVGLSRYEIVWELRYRTLHDAIRHGLGIHAGGDLEGIPIVKRVRTSGI